MGIVETAARFLGKDPNDVSNAVNQAKKLIGGQQVNSAEDVASAMRSMGMENSFIEKALKIAVPAAKMGKVFGVKELQNVDIDGVANKVRQIADIAKGGDKPKTVEGTAYRYDRPAYDRGNANYLRANKLPD